MVTWGELCVLNNLALDFVIVGIQHFTLDFLENALSIVGEVKEHVDLIGFVELADNSDLQSICLVQQLLVLEAGPTETNLKLFAKDFVVGEPLNTLSLILKDL